MEKPIVGKDIPFSLIDCDLLKVIEFIPQVKSTLNPYAFVTVEGTKFKGEAILPLFQKTDFLNLSEAWKQKKGEEEVLVFWTTKKYKNFIFNLFSAFLPKLWVRICPKESFEIETNKTYMPELSGEVRYRATQAIKEWKPEVIA
jgi:hypothetical protein